MFAEAMHARRAGDLAALSQFQQRIGKLMAIYSVGDDFVSAIKTAVSRKFGYMTPLSRNSGGALNEAQCDAIDMLFS